MRTRETDLVIVGAGVTGTALTYILARYSNVLNVIVLEKNPGPAQVNSSPLNNAQTSHDGGTETNYSLAHALEVKSAAVALRRYVRAKAKPGLYWKGHRMALGVGFDEVKLLERRFKEFAPHYPDLRLAYRQELARLEPKVMEGRDPDEPIAALVSTEGYAVNYQVLAESFLEDGLACNPGMEYRFNTGVKSVRREGELYVIETDDEIIRTKTVVFAAGAYSLAFAHQLGYGKEYTILNVGGNFYSAGPILQGKVYRVQQEGLPFAEVHGDPNVLDHNDTRFGPTTKPVFVMERHRLKTAVSYAGIGILSWRGILAMFRILSRKGLLPYIIENYFYDVPYFGKRLFVGKIRKIVPTLRMKDLQWHQNAGGLRPQIVNLETGQLEMGEKTIVGHNAVFETTPSPGASVCLRNAIEVANHVVEFLGEGYTLNRASIADDLGIFKSERAAA
jgi:malate dehydrogenase (quinone)